MRSIIAISVAVFLTGCAVAPNEHLYYEAAKSISRDNAMTQAACWSAITEIAKNSETSAKIGALALADRCKNQPVQLETPRRGLIELIGR